MARRYDYDLVVIGGGPAGYVAAIRASQAGAGVACIEKDHLGGVCTNVGCIPTKAMVHAARTILEIKAAKKIGIAVSDVQLDYGQLLEHRGAVVERLRGGIQTLLKANGVELIRGVASLEDAHTVAVDGEGGGRSVSGEKLLIATGSKSLELPIAPVDEKVILSSRGALELEELPESLIIVGGGYIGCEFASIFSALGVELTVVEIMDRLLPEMDEDCGREVEKLLKKAGCNVLTGTGLQGAKKTKGGVTAALSDGSKLKAQKMLVCVGRAPAGEGLGAEKIGIKAAERGGIAVNEHMQTSLPHVYAAGDVTGHIMLAHVATREATVAAAHATGKLTAKMSYRVVPACAFTIPQVASVGMTEQQAREKVGEVIVKKFPMRSLGMARVSGMTEGFAKMVCDAGSREVLGVHIACAEASSLIAEAALGMQLEITAEELAQTIHAHPTMPESLQEAAEAVIGKPVNWSG